MKKERVGGGRGEKGGGRSAQKYSEGIKDSVPDASCALFFFCR